MPADSTNPASAALSVESPTLIPSWLDGMKFCHILMDDAPAHYCGAPGADEGPTCQDYDGEEICPTCGLPTCPQCARMESLDCELEEIETHA